MTQEKNDQAAPISTDELRNLLDAATPGPWNVTTPVEGSPDFRVIKHGPYGFSGCGKYMVVSGQVPMEDASLIAIAPQLAAEVLARRSGLAAPAAHPVDEEWREIEQGHQPRLTDGYTAVWASTPGFWFVKGDGPAIAHDAPSAPAEVEGLVVLRNAADAATGDPARYPRRGIIDRYQSEVVSAYENGDLVASTAPTALQAEIERLTTERVQAQAEAAAAYERAADSIQTLANQLWPDGKRTELADHIRALATEPGTNALTEIVKQAVDAETRACTEIVRDNVMSSMAAEKAILARIDQRKGAE